MSLIDKIDKTNIPAHVAIIMDGNGRWAAQHGHERFVGHEKGAEAIRGVLMSAAKIGVKCLTVYAFSTENWSRPQSEVDALMGLMAKLIQQETPGLKKNGVRLQVIGDQSALPEEVQKGFQWSIDELKDCERITLVLALNYSGRWEITNACKQAVALAERGELKSSEITSDLVGSMMNTKDMPELDLLIRTSGEIRVSNFLLWQIAYAELYFTPVLWPDFAEEHLLEAIVDYQSRQRRFGKTSQQIEE